MGNLVLYNVGSCLPSFPPCLVAVTVLRDQPLKELTFLGTRDSDCLSANSVSSMPHGNKMGSFSRCPLLVYELRTYVKKQAAAMQ